MHRACCPNHVWSYDFVFDQTEDRRTLKCLTVVDEFTRQGLDIRVGRSITASDIIRILDEQFQMHGELFNGIAHEAVSQPTGNADTSALQQACVTGTFGADKYRIGKVARTIDCVRAGLTATSAIHLLVLRRSIDLRRLT